MKDWGLDGIDVDREYPTGLIEANNMILLLEDIRKELDLYADKSAPGHHSELSIAAPAGPQHYRILKLADIGKAVDHINLMTCDLTGSFHVIAGHTANLFTNEESLDTTENCLEDPVSHFDNIKSGLPA
ncbi:unnamed protein product [Fusarium langsethiae]|nr:unnamed protein product [Fusarium langsethiae]